MKRLIGGVRVGTLVNLRPVIVLARCDTFIAVGRRCARIWERRRCVIPTPHVHTIDVDNVCMYIMYIMWTCLLHIHCKEKVPAAVASWRHFFAPRIAAPTKKSLYTTTPNEW